MRRQRNGLPQAIPQADGAFSHTVHHPPQDREGTRATGRKRYGPQRHQRIPQFLQSSLLPQSFQGGHETYPGAISGNP